MKLRSRQSGLWSGLVAAALLFLMSTAHSQNPKGNPFTKFSGNWTGNGLIMLSNGTKERIRCRAGFTPAESFNVIGLKLDLKCAGDAYNFELQSELNYDGGAVFGTWTELSRGVNGRVTGTVKGDQISAVAESQTFTAMLELVAQGERQTVLIQSPGSEISEVRIGLNLRSRITAPAPPPAQ
jgi:hypothetical protein